MSAWLVLVISRVVAPVAGNITVPTYFGARGGFSIMPDLVMSERGKLIALRIISALIAFFVCGLSALSTRRLFAFK